MLVFFSYSAPYKSNPHDCTPNTLITILNSDVDNSLDISDEEMADSAFNQGSYTARSY